jgi:two-component system, cell cycle sensor histidine kinase and response regulator CckA
LLTTILDPQINRVKLDSGLLTQVLMNLSVNAHDAMPRGGKLTLETRNVEITDEYATTHPDIKAGRYVMIVVSDTGSGMTLETQAHIFEPFYTTKGVGKGTGLGLAVVHGIVKQSGGQIEVFSELNRGTSFKLYFPAIDEQVYAATLRDQEVDVRGTETILLVEDEVGVRNLAYFVLQTQGYNVQAASDGKAALRMVGSHKGPVHLLVTDVVMPVMNGREMAEELHLRYPQMKVLFTSGYTDDAVVRHGVLQAEVAFLQKPYSPQALARKVRQVLNQ